MSLGDLLECYTKLKGTWKWRTNHNLRPSFSEFVSRFAEVEARHEGL